MVPMPDEQLRHSVDAVRISTATAGMAGVQHSISERGTNSTAAHTPEAGQQHTRAANRQSYAHQRSQSGWDKLFRNMSERAELHPAEHTHTKAPDTSSRVPGIGEDAFLHEDVQYVDESDDTGQVSAVGGFSRGGVDNRGRSGTGASSAGSGLHYANSHIASTTQLNAHYEIPMDASEKALKPPPDDDEDHPTFLRYFHNHHSEDNPPEHERSGSMSRFTRFLHHESASSSSSSSNSNVGGEEEDDEKANKNKRMEELRHKFKRAVLKASVMTRKPQRKMKSSFPNGMFPFLQDALFVPMFYFMRDEHGHRAPPVIFDAISLAVTVSGTTLDSEDQHHFVVRIELQYGDIKWVIYRRLQDFITLHTMLTLRKFQGRVHKLPTFPQQFSYAIEKAKSFTPGHQRGDRMNQATADRKQALENYLIKVLRAMNMRPAYEICTFLELSAVSIVKDVGWKGKEGNLDRRVEHTTGQWCTPRDLRRWTRQWVIVRDSYIAFCSHISDPYPTDVLFADSQFDIKFRKKSGRNPLFPYRITVSNQYRRIQLRSDSERVINEWRHSIEQMKNTSAWAVPHRFASFAPIRDNSRVIWFVDGDDYFYAASEAIENATDCIYIEDWWLSPELHLRRPYAQNEEYRLDRLLKRKAEEGVKVYVVVYKEVTVSLTINSAYTKRKLQSLHPNIMVQRHPDHLAGGTMFWAHHEKMLIVDNTFAFIGGLDLCWGRYDTHGHRLADYYLPYKGKPYSHLQNFFGQDYNNARIHDFANVNDYEDTLINRRTTPRMPWHDVHMAMIGQPARDVSRHFIMRWNFLKSSKAMAKQRLPFLMPKGEYSVSRNDLQYRGTCRTQVLRSSAEWSLGISKESSIHTAYCEMIRDAKHFIYIENQFFISNAREDSGYTIKNRIAEALVDRIKSAHRRKEKFRVIVLMPLMPAFEGDVNAAGAATLKLVMHWQYQTICRGDHSIMSQLEKDGINMHDYIRFFGLRTYDVIRRYSDSGNEQDLSLIVGNAPLEVPGFDATLAQQGVPTIAKSPQAAGTTPSISIGTASAHPSPPVAAPLPVTSHASHPVATREPTGLSFSDPPHMPSDYTFRRPDQAFAADMFPMEDNNTRRSREMTRFSEHIERPMQKPPMIGRRSFNLHRPSFMKRRSSLSALGNLPLVGRSKQQQQDVELESLGSRSSDDDDYGRVPTYMRRMDNEGRRKTALRYLVRGTEHIKQYKKNVMGAKHKRVAQVGGELGHRDSDSEFGSSQVRLDMADVDNYVHPVPIRATGDSATPVFLADDEQKKMAGKQADRGEMAVLPEMAGAQYMRERLQAEAMPASAAGSVGHSRQKSSKTVPNNTPRRAKTVAESQSHVYPPLARSGAQVLEHEVFGKKPDTPSIAPSTTTMQPRQHDPTPIPHGHTYSGTPSVSADHQPEPEIVDQIVTELVYIHCKLMIVDDRYVIMGSANINDRSMVGNRDSEIAMIVEDTEPVVTTMNGRTYQAAKFAHSLRVQLCQEHTGVLDSVDQMRYINEMYVGNPPVDVNHSVARSEWTRNAKKLIEDPLSDAFFDMWQDTAESNEAIFRDVFRCVPDNTIETLDQYKAFIPGPDVPHGQAVPGRSTKETLEILKNVKGHLVPIPLNFLKFENLGVKLGDKEMLVPVEVFT